ncbi:MAG TPA: hypothetical protein DCE56_17990 [Cyanobacteria bacterium UBA8553]|nr:hypothetical protein [Cyanobacteria bacterium UBA8553]
MAGIGVTAIAASGILCASSLVTPQQTSVLLDTYARLPMSCANEHSMKSFLPHYPLPITYYPFSS